MSAMGGMSNVRGAFAVDEATAIAVLAAEWAGAYICGHDGERYQARRDGGGELLTGKTPDEMRQAIIADFAARPR